MTVAITGNHPPLADPCLFPADPLSDFATEDLGRTGLTLGSTPLIPDVRAPAHPIVASASFEPAKRRKLNGRWVVGTAMLVVGLLAGYAAGIATATRNAEDQNSSGRSLPTDRAPQHVASQAPAGRSSTELIAEVVHDTPPNSEPDLKPSQPQTVDVLERPESPPLNTGPATAWGVLHFESRPRGAQVSLNGRLVATTPFQLYEVPVGSHTVQVELQGYAPWVTFVNVEAGSHRRIVASLEQ